MNLHMLNAKDTQLRPLRANVESYSTQTFLVLGNKKKPCRLFLHRDTPPAMQELGAHHVEAAQAHVFFKGRNFLILSENRPWFDDSHLVFFQTLIPFDFKGRALFAFDRNQDILDQRIYCDSVIPNQHYQCLQFQGFTFLRSGDRVSIAHQPPNGTLGHFTLKANDSLQLDFSDV